MREFSENKFEKVFDEAIDILFNLEDKGYDSYFVGGCVRDFIMNKPFTDIDITTLAKPEDIKKIFYKTIDTGIKHGTVTVIYKKKFYEITTFRTEEAYINHRYPQKVNYVKNLDEDLKRRDFTINAMAIDKYGKIIDFHNGILDINNKIIRTVNDPNERFYEDALRMLRAFRFASNLGFDIEKKTLQAIEKNKKLIEYISIERVVIEFKKILSGTHNYKVLSKLLNTGINKYIPFFKFVENHIDFKNFSFEAAIFYLLHFNNIDIKELKNLKLSNKEINKIKLYVKINKDFKEKTTEEMVYLYDFQSLSFINNIFNYVSENELYSVKLPIKSFLDVDITVKEILNMFPNRKEGIWIKEAIKNIELAIILKKINNEKEVIKKYLKEVL